MGNNEEIRKKMETYRIILLVLNWSFAFALIIFGINLVSSRYTQGIGIGVIIGSVILGIIGHFLINVRLAIPFILLNNGDILESLKGKAESTNISPEKDLENDNYWKCGKCGAVNDIYLSNCIKCGEEFTE